MSTNTSQIFKQKIKKNIYDIAAVLKRSKNSFQGKRTFANKAEKKAFFFIFPGIQEYIHTLSVVGKCLIDKNVSVTYVSCENAIHSCVHSELHPTKSSLVCANCKYQNHKILGKYGLNYLPLSRYGNHINFKEIEAQVDDCEDLNNFIYKGKRLSDLALVDLALIRKQRSFSNLSEEELKIARRYIKSILFVYEMALKLLADEKPDFICFNSDYSHNMAIANAATELGIRTINLGMVSHRLADRRRSFVFEGLWEEAMMNNYHAWSDWREIPLKKEEVIENFEDVLIRLNPQGTGLVYSPPFDKNSSYREEFKVGDRKFLVAFTSSEDEAISTKKCLDVFGVEAPYFEQPYKTQIEWLEDLVEKMKTREDIFLAVRIHPREGKNRFEKDESEHLKELKKRFYNNLPENIRFIWPEENISSYSLGAEADLVLISWSNIGMEFARLGVPVLASMVRISSVPHDDFIVRKKNREEYFKALDDLLGKEHHIDTLARCHRWYTLSKFRCSVSFDDIFPDIRAHEPTSYSSSSENRDVVYEAIVKGTKLQSYYLEGREEFNEADKDQERSCLQRNLLRVLHFIFTGEVLPFENDLKKEDFRKTEDAIVYTHKDKAIDMKFEMVKRLYHLVEQV